MERVFADGEMEMEPTTPEEAFTLAERLHERRHLLAGYLKLVLYSGIDTSSAVNVLGQFVKVYSILYVTNMYMCACACIHILCVLYIHTQ